MFVFFSKLVLVLGTATITGKSGIVVMCVLAVN